MHFNIQDDMTVVRYLKKSVFLRKYYSCHITLMTKNYCVTILKFRKIKTHAV